MKKSILLLLLASCVLQTTGANAQDIVVCNTYSRLFHKDENRQIIVSTTEDEDFSTHREVYYRIWDIPKNDGEGQTVTAAVTRNLSETRVTFADKFSDLPNHTPAKFLKINTKSFGNNKYHGSYKGRLLGDTTGLGNDGFYREVQYRVICTMEPRALGPDKTPEEIAEIARCREQVPTRSLGLIVRSIDGQIRKMSQYEAVSYCATRGGLPTVKQLALAFNAKGVSDTAREGLREVAPRNETPFYYTNYNDYERPKCDESYEWFWSSSVYDEHLAFFFYGHDGHIELDSRDTKKFAVLCVDR